MTPPPGVAPMGRDLGEAHVAAAAERGARRSARSAITRRCGPVPLAGALTYAYDGNDVRIASGEIATEDTFVTFNGNTTLARRERRGCRFT